MNRKLLSYNSPNLGGYQHEEIERIMYKMSRKCQCRKDLIYKCLEQTCSNSDLICPNCDVFSLNGQHFNHSFTYVLPLFKDARQINFKTIREKTQKYINTLYQIQKKLTGTLKSVKELISEVTVKADTIDQIIENSGQNVFMKRMEKLEEYENLDELLRGLKPFSLSQFQNLMRQITEINNSESNNLLKENQNQSNIKGEKTQNLLISLIQEGIQLNQCEFSIPFLQLNRQKLSYTDITLDFQLEDLYTEKFAYTEVQINLSKAKNLRLIYLELSRIRNCRKIKIIQGQSQFGFTSGWAESIKGKIRFEMISELQIDGNEQFIKGVLQSFYSKGTIESLILRTDQLFSNLETIKNISNVKQLKITAKIEKKQDPYYVFVNFCFSHPHITAFSVTYDENIKQSYYWSEYQINSLKEHLQKSKKYLIDISLNTVEWQDPTIINYLNQCEKLIEFSLVIAPPENLNIDVPMINIQKEISKLKKKCLNRKRVLYSIAKAVKQKGNSQILRKKELFPQLFQRFIL